MSMLKRAGKWTREMLGRPYVQIGILVFLISLLSFGIGFLFGRDFNPPAIIIEQAEAQ